MSQAPVRFEVAQLTSRGYFTKSVQSWREGGGLRAVTATLHTDYSYQHFD